MNDWFNQFSRYREIINLLELFFHAIIDDVKEIFDWKEAIQGKKKN